MNINKILILVGFGGLVGLVETQLKGMVNGSDLAADDKLYVFMAIRIVEVIVSLVVAKIVIRRN